MQLTVCVHIMPSQISRCYAQRRLTRWALLRLGNPADEALSNAMALEAHLYGQLMRTGDDEMPYVKYEHLRKNTILKYYSLVKQD